MLARETKSKQLEKIIEMLEARDQPESCPKAPP